MPVDVSQKTKDPNNMNLFGKYGGYRKLDSFTLASVIQLATWRFCETFLDWRNTTSSAAGLSPKTPTSRPTHCCF